jgi:hypothetical protein
MSARISLALVAAAVLTIGPALIEGYYVNRWGTPPDLEGAAHRVGSFPREFGSWTFVEEGAPLHEEVCRELAVKGYINRTYKHRDSDTLVQVLLMVGQAGPLLRHPPNICYANMANEQIGDMTKIHTTATDPPSTFNLLEYKRARSVTNDRFLVAYAMATDAAWKVPAMPRVEFGAAPMLYKVQLLTPLDPSKTRESGTELLTQFTDDFCAAFQKHVESGGVSADEKPAG